MQFIAPCENYWWLRSYQAKDTLHVVR